MVARVHGRCVICDAPFIVGSTEIRWQRVDGVKGVRWCANHGRALPADVLAKVRAGTQGAYIPRDDGQETPPVPTVPTVPTVPPSTSDGDPATTILAALESLRGISRDEAQAIATETAEAVARSIAEAALASGAVPRPVEITVRQYDGSIRFAALAHYLVAKVLKMIGATRNIYLWGAPGGGKTHAAKQIADSIGATFSTISLEPTTLAHVLLGYRDVATGTYHSTPFRAWFENGGVFLIDELDNAHPSVLVALNSAVDNGFLAFPDGNVVQRHADAILIGTGNTSGRGAHPAFPSRKPFDKAFASRLCFLEWDYDNALEGAHARAVAKAVVEDEDEADVLASVWVQYVRDARSYVNAHALPLFVSPRVTFYGLRLLAVGFSPEYVADALLFQGIDSATRTRIVEAVPFPKVTVKA